LIYALLFFVVKNLNVKKITMFDIAQHVKYHEKLEFFYKLFHSIITSKHKRCWENNWEKHSISTKC